MIREFSILVCQKLMELLEMCWELLVEDLAYSELELIYKSTTLLAAHQARLVLRRTRYLDKEEAAISNTTLGL
jgi:hypothetical protein